MKLTILAVLFVLLELGNGLPTSNRAFKFSPVILVPGDGGSQVEGRLNKSSGPHFWCTKIQEDWFTLWLNLQFIVPGVTDCFADNLKLRYNHTDHTTYNQPGVEIRVPGFGNTSGVDYMDPSRHFFTSYFEIIIQHLEKELGYVRGVNVRGAPYDFRKAPNEMEDYLKRVRVLIEETYVISGNRRVVLIGHSLGNLYILYLLNHLPQHWKDKYIRAFVSIGAPYGGAIKAMKMFASGYNVDIRGLSEISVREMQRSMPSSAFLLPYDTFWDKNDILIYGPTQNYTVSNYELYFKDINFTLGTMMRNDTENLIKDLTPPGVPVYCLYSVDVPTPKAYHYAEVKPGYNWYDYQPVGVDFGDGDGTVNIRSALGCKRWIGRQNAPVVLKKFSALKHVEMLRSKELSLYIIELLKSL